MSAVRSGDTSCSGFGIARELRGERLARRRAGERRHAGQQLVGQQPDGVDVNAMIGGRVAGELFGRHVRGRPDCDAGRRHGADRQRGADRLRDAEVGDERVRALREDVRRLDVAMDHAARVGESERIDDIVQDTSDLARA